MLHFFSTRKEGVNNSHQSVAWRLGSGNVHTSLKSITVEQSSKPSSPEEQEFVNAIDNLKALVADKGLKPAYEVILFSQYGKGISVVTDELLASKDLPRDPSGRLVIPADGLFTTKENVLLLNKSGDAHALILESPQAIGIVVGSWRCIKKGILPLMLEHFLIAGSDPKDIKITIGPGLGPDSYDLPEENYLEILKENDTFKEAFKPNPEKKKGSVAELEPLKPAAAEDVKTDIKEKIATITTDSLKPVAGEDRSEIVAAQTSEKKTPPEEIKSLTLAKPKKYILNFVKLIKIFAQELQIQVVDNETATTFNRTEWKLVKSVAREEKNPKVLMEYYQKQLYFSARLYTHVDKNIKKIVSSHRLEMPEGVEQPKSTYDGTGRCLNGVIKL